MRASGAGIDPLRPKAKTMRVDAAKLPIEALEEAKHGHDQDELDRPGGPEARARRQWRWRSVCLAGWPGHVSDRGQGECVEEDADS